MFPMGIIYKFFLHKLEKPEDYKPSSSHNINNHIIT